MTDKMLFKNVPVISGEVLGCSVLRGYARLCDLARISQADIYDPKSNPTGTQRDLNPKHAKDAYDYVKTRQLGYWPEVFLCVREKSVFSKRAKPHSPYMLMTLDVSAVAKLVGQGKVVVSRVDGNHRLHYADGMTPGYPAIEKIVSFCIAYNLTLNEEISLFRDINNNQRRMNTSHLDNIEARLSGQKKLGLQNPSLYIAKRLNDDGESTLRGRIYEGGRVPPAGSMIPLRTLKTGIEYMLSRATKLTALPDTDSKYIVIRNFFSAVKKWIPEGWNEPKKFIVLRGAGLWGICFLGAEVIDRALGAGQYLPDAMLKILKSGKTWDWSNEGDFQGLSGRGGAVRIRDQVVAELVDAQGISVRDLYKKIMMD